VNKSKSFFVVALNALLGCMFLVVPVEASATNEQTYVVLYKQSSTFTVASKEITEESKFGNDVLDTYTGGIKGLEVKLGTDDVTRLKSDPSVAVVAPVQSFVIKPIVQAAAPESWGIDRIDQRSLPFNSSYSPKLSGQGVRAYVIDTGVFQNHPEFVGRIEAGFDSVGDKKGSNDCHGHGTHVAGTIGGKTVGVAPGVQIIPVRVLDCLGGGDTASVISGIEYVINNAKSKGLPAVANLSLGGPTDSALDFALERLIDSGVTTIVSAGNESSNACFVSPARVSKAITVGATTSNDNQSSYSNYGSCVDIYAPGSSIFSSFPIGDFTIARQSPSVIKRSGYGTISGTSMASPHVAGAAAQLLSASKSATPATITNTLVSGATSGVITGVTSGSPNRLLFVEPNSVPSTTTTTSTSSTTSSTTTTSLFPTTTTSNGNPLLTVRLESIFPSSVTLKGTQASQNPVTWMVRVVDPIGGRLTSTAAVGSRLCPANVMYPDGAGCTGAMAIPFGNRFDRTYRFTYWMNPNSPAGDWIPYFDPLRSYPTIKILYKLKVTSSVAPTTTTVVTTTTTSSTSTLPSSTTIPSITTTSTPGSNQIQILSDSFSPQAIRLRGTQPSQNSVTWSVRIYDPFGGRLVSTAAVGSRLCPANVTYPDGAGCTGAMAIPFGNRFDRTYRFTYWISPSAVEGNWIPYFDPLAGYPTIAGKSKLAVTARS
jgi:subtilisin family serine protease